jgi:hypothetical protein
MAGLTGLEPATFRVTGGRSNPTELQPLASELYYILEFFTRKNIWGEDFTN